MEYTNKLNQLLANYQIHYQNLRSLHWNVKGEGFFELHVKYEEWYTRALVIIDELAERILSTGAQPLSNFSEYLNSSEIKELNPIVKEGRTGMEYILNAEQILLNEEKSLLKLSDDLNDEGTNSLMSDLIREHEKNNWMVKAWLKR